MTILPAACKVRPAGDWHRATDTVVLSHDQRKLFGKRLTTVRGDSFLLDLAGRRGVVPGDALELTDGRLIAVVAADEDLLEVRADGLQRVAWHLGRRHVACQIEAGRLLVRANPGVAQLLSALGANVQPVAECFDPEPESGAGPSELRQADRGQADRGHKGHSHAGQVHPHAAPFVPDADVAPIDILKGPFDG